MVLEMWQIKAVNGIPTFPLDNWISNNNTDISNKNVCIFDFPWQDYKKTQKITWLAVADKGPFVPCICVQYDHIISKAILGKEEDFKQYVNRDSKVYVFSWYVCKHPTIENGFFFSWFVCPFVWHLIQFLLFSILCSVEQQLN
jgi:hypothetical protein